MQNLNTYRPTQVTYSQFKELLDGHHEQIVSAVVVQRGQKATFKGELSEEAPLKGLEGVKHVPGSRYFTVNLPFVDSDMVQQWDKLDFPYTFEQEKFSVWDILGIVPWVLILLLWIFMIRQMQAGQRGVFSFGKSKAKLYPMDRPRNTFTDVAGVQEAKIELQEIIEFLKDPQKFRRLGGRIPKGVLLLGPPGTGKTLLARCVAGEAGVPFLSMSGSDFVEMFVGVGASRVRDLFETAKKSSPCIIFIDEIDAVGRQRGAGLGGGHDEREQTLNQMLVEMDGFEVNSGVILVAATNRPDVLDPALLRPGRFDRQIVVDVPDINGREGILRVHTKNVPLAPDVDLKTIARGTPGFVGADLANLVNEAALLAARFGQKAVTMLDFEEAKDRVFMGAERKSLVLSAKEKEHTAYHEAGHAICNVYCENTDPLHKVTIIPRGRALGVTWSLPREDKYSESRESLMDRICLMMGGRAAEDIVLKTLTTGAANDIKEATRLIRRMVCDYGMTEELGPLTYGEKNEQIFLGREFNQHRDFSERTAEEIDTYMRRTAEEQFARARKILTDHFDEMQRLAEALIEHELLDAEEVMKVIRGEKLETVKKTRIAPEVGMDQKERGER
ncbi:MAG: ATP-dependent zinc metalloprotease FtsH, partial [Chitinivibrionales bacterium]|nr:ATP-dependent zinc metalloprotease FtsH [Chitinivibrionales bacterium]